MKIYPAIDMMSGKVVRLTKGLFDQKSTYSDDPLKIARSFKEAGAEYLHIVDLDGAKAGRPQQTEIISQIVQECSLKVQVGGGIRKEEDVMKLLKAGAERVIIGSLAVKDMPKTKSFFEIFGGDRITLGLDVMLDEDGQAMVATHGWQELSDLEANSLIEEYQSLGLEQVLCTDISRDGTLSEPNFALYETLSDRFPKITFLASGGMRTTEQVKTLKSAGIGGAIIGKAIYEGTLDLKEALQC